MAAIALGVLVGCVRTETMTSTFDASEAAFIEQAGTSTIHGQAFLKTVGGEVRYGAGNQIILIPQTAYARERIAKLYGQSKCNAGGVKFDSDDPSYMRMVRQTKANGEGRFKFENIAAGSYFVVTQLTWGVPGQYGVSTTGCNLYEQVSVRPGETVEVLISGS
jgi:hypothetical protein